MVKSGNVVFLLLFNSFIILMLLKSGMFSLPYSLQISESLLLPMFYTLNSLDTQCSYQHLVEIFILCADRLSLTTMLDMEGFTGGTCVMYCLEHLKEVISHTVYMLLHKKTHLWIKIFYCYGLALFNWLDGWTGSAGRAEGWWAWCFKGQTLSHDEVDIQVCELSVWPVESKFNLKN